MPGASGQGKCGWGWGQGMPGESKGILELDGGDDCTTL